ncbi:transmembrane protein 267 isoform X2 [Folsomia candida]|nr:transmembrane protein 267 isoform X2 [Folsomia candida]
MIHVWIGILSWIIFTEDPFGKCQDLIAVALGASVIDLDHFLAAQSFSVDAAMSAGKRGIFHCTGLAILISLVLFRLKGRSSALLFLLAVIPHHLRDAQRRGLYVLPFTHQLDTPPLNRALVRLLLPLVPWVLILANHLQAGNPPTISRVFNV